MWHYLTEGPSLPQDPALGLWLRRGHPQGLWAGTDPPALSLNPGEEGPHLGWSWILPGHLPRPPSPAPQGPQALTLPLVTLEPGAGKGSRCPLTREPSLSDTIASSTLDKTLPCPE